MAILTQCQYGMRTETVSVYTTFWGFFEQKLNKCPSHFNKPPPKTPNLFIGRRRGIDADTVLGMFWKLELEPTIFLKERKFQKQ